MYPYEPQNTTDGEKSPIALRYTLYEQGEEECVCQS